MVQLVGASSNASKGCCLGHCLFCGSGPGLGGVREAADWCFSDQCFSLALSLSRGNEKMSSFEGEIFFK